MQDRYTGDIGDYVKYGLLRILADGRRLGVAWYLFPDERHNDDGRHISYLKDPDKWRAHDPALFDTLEGIVACGKRTVASIEDSGILRSAKFSGEVLSAPPLSATARRDWRAAWFMRVKEALSDCDIIFADPDNGLCEDEQFRPGQVRDWKRLPLHEAKALAEGRTAIIYHHNTRRPGGHVEEIKSWINRLGSGTLALRWRAYSGRTFFVVNPSPETTDVLSHFARNWGPKAEVHM